MMNCECFCGVPHSYLSLMAQEYIRPQWSKTSLTWSVAGNLPGLTLEMLNTIYAEAWEAWVAVCGITAARILIQGADVNKTTGRIDGPGGVLAWSELPSGDDRPLTQRYDNSESWDQNFLRVVASHEIGHALGLPHLARGNLMQPTYDPTITKPQAGDIAEIQRRYGPPKTRPVPEPAPPLNPGAADKILLWKSDLTESGLVNLSKRVGALIQGQGF